MCIEAESSAERCSRLIIHVGFPRAASTTLQHGLSRNIGYVYVGEPSVSKKIRCLIDSVVWDSQELFFQR